MLAKVSRTVLLEMGAPLVVVGFSLSELLLGGGIFLVIQIEMEVGSGRREGEERDLEAIGETVSVEGARHGFCCLLVSKLASDTQD